MNPKKGARRSAHGFTLVELIITVAIVGLLATVAMPLAELTVRRAKESELRIALRDVRGAIDAYRKAAEQGRIALAADASGYPPNLDALVEGAEDATSPDRKKIYFLRRLPRDPFFADREVAAAQTWGLRSYSSSPEDPQPGDDVFDVRSLHAGVGLDGIPYSEW
jgi:general secretion pathway protein G